MLLGFPSLVSARWQHEEELWRLQELRETPSLPPRKKFNAKCGLPVVRDYRQNAKETYWLDWPKVSWENARKFKSTIDPDKLEEVAWETAYPNKAVLGNVLADIREGANIGVDDEHRQASDSTNALSALEYGERVSDSLCKMMKEGFIMGPFDE